MKKNIKGKRQKDLDALMPSLLSERSGPKKHPREALLVSFNRISQTPERKKRVDEMAMKKKKEASRERGRSRRGKKARTSTKLVGLQRCIQNSQRPMRKKRSLHQGEEGGEGWSMKEGKNSAPRPLRQRPSGSTPHLRGEKMVAGVNKIARDPGSRGIKGVLVYVYQRSKSRRGTGILDVRPSS